MNEGMEEYLGRFQSCNYFAVTPLCVTVPSAFPCLGMATGVELLLENLIALSFVCGWDANRLVIAM